MISESLQKKIDRAIKLLKSTCDGKVVEVCFSGGKDSEVILELAKMSGINYRAIYKNTTIDPPKTISHCKSKGVEIMQPKISFFDLIKKKGFPTRRARFCCEELKEYKILDVAIQGIRRCESVARAKRYSEPQVCRFYGSKKNCVSVILPILDWSDKDVEEFIKERNIQCHPLYYDEKGNFHVEKRLGCMACPLQSDNGKQDFKQHPNLVKLWCYAGNHFLSTHPNTSTMKEFGNVYNLFFHNVFTKSYEEYKMKMTENLFGDKLDSKNFLEKYFNIKFKDNAEAKEKETKA